MAEEKISLVEIGRIEEMGVTDREGVGFFRLIEKDGQRFLRIVVNSNASHSIHLEVCENPNCCKFLYVKKYHHADFSRIFWPDLMKLIIENLGGKIEKIIIRDSDNNYFVAAQIYFLDKDGNQSIFDYGSSDLVALAIKFRAPIFVEEEIFNKKSLT